MLVWVYNIFGGVQAYILMTVISLGNVLIVDSAEGYTRALMVLRESTALTVYSLEVAKARLSHNFWNKPSKFQFYIRDNSGSRVSKTFTQCT